MSIETSCWLTIYNPVILFVIWCDGYSPIALFHVLGKILRMEELPYLLLPPNYIYSPALGIINGQCRVTGYILILSDCWSECLSYKKIEVYAYNVFFILQILFGMVCRMSGEIMCSPVVSLVGFLKAFCRLTESIPSLVYYFSGVRCLFFI